MRHASARIKSVAGALIVLLTLTFGTAPLAAAEEGPSVPAKPITESAAKVVANMDTTNAVAPAQGGAPAEQGATKKSFFATPKGIAALVIFAGITAYTIHTRISDHIHSPIR